jgi:hypothetical protein
MCEAPVAINLNQTSSSAPDPVHAVCDCVAPTEVPETDVLHAGPAFTGKLTAPLQLSFASGVVTQTVKGFEPEDETASNSYTRI